MVAQCRSEVLQNAPLEHSAILLTCIQQSSVLKTNLRSTFEWPLKIGFNVYFRLQIAKDTDQTVQQSQVFLHGGLYDILVSQV